MLLYAVVPGFYAEIERAADATLAGRPVVVGGDPRKRGLVQAATLDAQAAGVRLEAARPAKVRTGPARKKARKRRATGGAGNGSVAVREHGETDDVSAAGTDGER